MEMENILIAVGAFLFFSMGVFFLPISLKLRSSLMGVLLLNQFFWGCYLFDILPEFICYDNFEKLGTVALWAYLSIMIFSYGIAGIYFLFSNFMHNTLLLMAGMLAFFVSRAWFKFRNDITPQAFWVKVSKYLLLRWFLGVQIPLLISYPFVRSNASINPSNASINPETYQPIPYTWNIDNAQFRMDLNYVLLLVSIPLSIAVLAWCHKRYTQKRAE